MCHTAMTNKTHQGGISVQLFMIQHSFNTTASPFLFYVFVFRVKAAVVLWAWSVLLEHEETCATER